MKHLLQSVAVAFFYLTVTYTFVSDPAMANTDQEQEESFEGQVMLSNDEQNIALPQFDTFIYITKAEDTIESISRKFGVTIDDLVQANQLPSPYELTEGQPLTIPIDSIQDLSNSDDFIEYVVKPGDTLSEIGQEYGVDWHELAILNKLTNPHLILIDQILYLPASEKRNRDIIIFYYPNK